MSDADAPHWGTPTTDARAAAAPRPHRPTAAAPWPHHPAAEATGLHASALASLTAWQPPTPDQSSLREAYLALLASTPDCLWRPHAPGHLTASAIVLSHDRTQVLLVLHPRAGTWLPPGGHLEPDDDSLQAAALREVAEETGLHDVMASAHPAVLNAHPFTCSLGLPTRHLDVCFALTADPGPDGEPPVPVISEESDDLRWWPIDDLPDGPAADRVAAAVSAALTTLEAAVDRANDGDASLTQ